MPFQSQLTTLMLQKDGVAMLGYTVKHTPFKGKEPMSRNGTAVVSNGTFAVYNLMLMLRHELLFLQR